MDHNLTTSDSNHKYALGIDVGGTKIMFLLIDQSGNMVAKETIPTVVEPDPLGYIGMEVRRFLDKVGVDASNIIGTGMGVPAVVDFENGIVVNCPALRIENVNLKAYFQDVLPQPLYIDNDVNMAVLGEKWQGSVVGFRDVVLVAVGTGLGAGIMLNNKVHRGTNGFAGEIGYFHIDPFIGEFEPNLDNFGPLESVASGSGIATQATALLSNYPDSLLHNQVITSKDVFAAASAGDKLAQLVIERTVNYLAFGISNIVALLNPQIVVIGGGVSQVGESFIEGVRQRLRHLITLPIKVVGAALGGDAGAFGAAAMVIFEGTA